MKNLVFVNVTDGTGPVTPDSPVNSTDPAYTGYTTLVSGKTYHAEIGFNKDFGGGGQGGKFEWHGLGSMHWKWDATLVATITIEGTNFKEKDVTDALADGWVDVAAITDVTPAASAAQSLNTSEWKDLGYGRLRAKIVVTTGGKLRGSFHSKAA